MRRFLRLAGVRVLSVALLLSTLGLIGCVHSEKVVLSPYLGAPPQTVAQPEWRRIPPEEGKPPEESKPAPKKK